MHIVDISIWYKYTVDGRHPGMYKTVLSSFTFLVGVGAISTYTSCRGRRQGDTNTLLIYPQSHHSNLCGFVFGECPISKLGSQRARCSTLQLLHPKTNRISPSEMMTFFFLSLGPEVFQLLTSPKRSFQTFVEPMGQAVPSWKGYDGICIYQAL